MSLREQLHAYIARLERRLRWSALLRGIAILAGSALVATLVLVTIANALAFSKGSVSASRFALILILAISVAAGLAIPLRRLTRPRVVRTAEAAFPQFAERLLTFTERDRDDHDPFMELLAADTLELAQTAEPSLMVSDSRLRASLGIAAGALAILIWIIAAGPGFIGYGASLLWTGPHRDKPALYDLRVLPGDAVVRRHADQLVSAIPTGLGSPGVMLHARYGSSPKWEEIAMQAPRESGSFARSYQFLLAGLPENVEYYVTAGAMTSKHFNIRVTDLPSVKQIRVTYRYPAWTGMPPETEERGGDLRAVIGTAADLEISTDRPLPGVQIQLDNGPHIQLTGGQDNVYRGTVMMDQDGVYHIAGMEQGQPVRVSEDFFIEARKPDPPQITLLRPSHGDYHASPIEELTVSAKATDEYGLNGLALHYSVNGGPDTTVNLLGHKGEKQASGATLLSLENFKLVPGDLVSVYASANDGNSEARTDILFIQADPFERNYSQSQVSGGGGGGGGGDDSSAQISRREKEIISETFKAQGNKNSTRQQAADIAKLLYESQSTLHDQALSLSGRLQARELTDEIKAISDFQKDMIAASQAMAPAAEQLKQQNWKDSIPNEQKALQFLLRAEATFREIEVAFGASGGGGGGAARDLAALFALELDTQKNQYETQQSSASTAEQRAQAIDDALKKLDELAKREQDLAQQQRNGIQTAEQKWQQEMLQREAQQLQQQMEQQLAQNGPQSQQTPSNGQTNGSSSSSSSGGQQVSQGNSSSANSQQSPESRQQGAEQALDRLRQAVDDMRRAGTQNASSADSRRAADRLREATDLLGGLHQQDSAARLNSMAQTAGQLAERQKQQADHVRDLLSQLSAGRTSGQQPKYPSPQEVDKMVADRQKVADDLEHLTQQMRSAARDLASAQPAASTKLRGALDGLDEKDLNTRMQRSSDWLRGGQFSDQAESGLTGDLQQLSNQIDDAARALGRGQPTSKAAELNRAMDDLSRLRDQLAGLSQGSNPQAGQGRAAQTNAQGGGTGGVANSSASPIGNPAGGTGDRNGNRFGGYDTGNTRISGRAVAPQQGPNPTDAQREIDQGLTLLNGLRAAARDNPEAQQELQSLIDQMRRLDPSRFPGNPALMEKMHQNLIGGVDELELQLRRQLEEIRGGTIRSADPAKIPPGYQNSVAEYYRKLSAGNH